jgi:hypothetical protein
MTTTRTSNTKAVDLIANRVGFTGNNLYGVVQSFDSVVYQTGRLPQEFETQLRFDRPSYIVYSYGTPIAWYCDKGWFIPDTKYSTTTSKHQNYVRRAIA